MSRKTFPALRCRMGQWIYYVTYFRLNDISDWIKSTDEVHQSKELAKWIQRRLDSKHAGRIAKYLSTDQRFFSAIVVGMYGGKPKWGELGVKDPLSQLSDAEEIDLAESLGLVQLKGKEKLFAIDGQHRVAGIKRAVAEGTASKSDEIAVILIGHQASADGMARTRRLFTTLNQTAKKVSKADLVALDEDNTFAVVTRQLIDESKIFSNKSLVSFAATSAINESDPTSLTSVIGLFEIVRDLYPRRHDAWPTRAIAARTRVGEDVVSKIYALNERYWETLAEKVPEYREVIENKNAKARSFRNHLLFRPVGQRAFASSVELLMSRGFTVSRAINRLLSVEMDIRKPLWKNVLWNTAEGTILWKNRHRIGAESMLMREIDQAPRNNRSEEVLDKLLSQQVDGEV